MTSETKVYPSGNVYTGPLKDGRPHGWGRLAVAAKAMTKWKGQREGEERGSNVYEGDFVEGKFTGWGEVRMANGCRYRGEFRNRMAHGEGRMWFQNGDVYTGKWKQGKMHDDNGTLVFAPGGRERQYTGGFKDDVIHGYGKYDYTDGSRYIGEFKCDKKNGTGEFTYADGRRLKGSFKNDKLHGHGRFEYQGDLYVGDFMKGLKHGLGEFRYENGAVYKGGWTKDVYHGRGILKDLDHEVDGFFANGQPHGECKVTYSNGEMFAGTFRNDEKVAGTFTFHDGEVYVGEFANGKSHGRGAHAFLDGSRYEGNWSEDEMHGMGKLTKADGTVFEGTWSHDQKHGPFTCKHADGNVFKEMYWNGSLVSRKRLCAESGASDAVKMEQTKEQTRTQPPPTKAFVERLESPSGTDTKRPMQCERKETKPNTIEDVIAIKEEETSEVHEASSLHRENNGQVPSHTAGQGSSDVAKTVKTDEPMIRENNDNPDSEEDSASMDFYRDLCIKLTKQINPPNAKGESPEGGGDRDRSASTMQLQMELIDKLHSENKRQRAEILSLRQELAGTRRP